MRRLKRFASALTVVTLLSLPLGFVGCAGDTAAPEPAAPAAQPETETIETEEIELGEPEAGSEL